MIRKGDIVEIKEKYQDEGDNTFIWMAVCDEIDNQVMITPLNCGMKIRPICLLERKWLRKKLNIRRFI